MTVNRRLSPQGATYNHRLEVSIGLNAIREIAIASDKIRYHGQAVAAVAAVDLFTAEEAARLVAVEFTRDQRR